MGFKRLNELFLEKNGNLFFWKVHSGKLTWQWKTERVITSSFCRNRENFFFPTWQFCGLGDLFWIQKVYYSGRSRIIGSFVQVTAAVSHRLVLPFQILFLLLPWEMIQFDRHIFQMGWKKPPTRNKIIYCMIFSMPATVFSSRRKMDAMSPSMKYKFFSLSGPLRCFEAQ